MYLVNKNIVNLIDDIFCKMGFKTETDSEKVIIRINNLFWIILIILIIFTVSILGSPGSWNCRSRMAGQTR